MIKIGVEALAIDCGLSLVRLRSTGEYYCLKCGKNLGRHFRRHIARTCGEAVAKRLDAVAAGGAK